MNILTFPSKKEIILRSILLLRSERAHIPAHVTAAALRAAVQSLRAGSSIAWACRVGYRVFKRGCTNDIRK